MPKPFKFPFIRVNDQRIDLDAKALAAGDLRLDEGALSEQCEGCGEDIMQEGSLVRWPKRGGSYFVECSCKESYIITESLSN